MSPNFFCPTLALKAPIDKDALHVAVTVEATAKIILGALKSRPNLKTLPESTVEKLVVAYRRLRHAP